MYEERGWDLPEGGAGHPAKKARATPTKRASAEESEPETPSKKPRVARKKQAKSQTPEHKVEGTDDEEAFGGVKSEPEEV